MNKIAIILIMTLFFAGFFPGIFTGASAPLFDRGGISYLYFTSPLYGGDKPADQQNANAPAQDEGPVLYKVMTVTLIIWFGISAYLVFLHVKIAGLEKKINE